MSNENDLQDGELEQFLLLSMLNGSVHYLFKLQRLAEHLSSSSDCTQKFHFDLKA